MTLCDMKKRCWLKMLDSLLVHLLFSGALASLQSTGAQGIKSQEQVQHENAKEHAIPGPTTSLLHRLLCVPLVVSCSSSCLLMPP